MSATTTLKFILNSPDPTPDPDPTPTPTPTPTTPSNTTTTVSTPNTGENGTNGDNIGGTVFSTLFILIGLAALIVFLAKYFKKNRHISFMERGSFHISMRPRVFVTAGLVLAVAFLGSSILTRGFNQNERDADAASVELGVSVTSEMTFDVDRGKSAYLTDNVSVSTNGGSYTLQVSTDNSQFCREGSTTDCLSSTSGDITSNDTNKLSSLSTNEWGMSLVGYDNAGKIWGAVPTTAKTIVKKDSTSADTDVTKVYYGVNVGSELPDGTYYGRVTYTAFTEKAVDYKVTTVNGYVGPTGTDDNRRFKDGVEVVIRPNCPAETPVFVNWTSDDIAVSSISGPDDSGLYTFTMPAKDVTVTAHCKAADPEPKAMKIVYNVNAPSSYNYSGTTADTDIPAGTEKVTLSTNGFSVVLHDFVGWACSKSATTKDYSSGQANVSVAGLINTKKCPIDTSKDPQVITVYAIWKKKSYLQDVEPVDCDLMTVLQTYTLPDKRDDKSYSFRKYADGRCWLRSDLDYRPSGSTPLSPATTDISTSKTITFSTSGTSGALYHTQSSYSTLYNYYAATAGQWNNQSAGTIMANSLCPAHWKMPDAVRESGTVSGTTGELWSLAKFNIGSANGGGVDKSDVWKQAFTFANNNASFEYRGTTYSNLHGPHFTYNGAWDFSSGSYADIGGTTGSAGNYGSYFLNTITDGSRPMAFNPQKAGPDYWDINDTDPAHGSSVRCLLRTAEQMSNRSRSGPNNANERDYSEDNGSASEGYGA